MVSCVGFSTQPCSDNLLKKSWRFPSQLLSMPSQLLPHLDTASIWICAITLPFSSLAAQWWDSEGLDCGCSPHGNGGIAKFTPGRKRAKRFIQREQLLAPLVCGARHSMTLAPAFSSHYLPYLASFHPALPSH